MINPMNMFRSNKNPDEDVDFSEVESFELLLRAEGYPSRRRVLKMMQALLGKGGAHVDFMSGLMVEDYEELLDLFCKAHHNCCPPTVTLDMKHHSKVLKAVDKYRREGLLSECADVGDPFIPSALKMAAKRTVRSMISSEAGSIVASHLCTVLRGSEEEEAMPSPCLQEAGWGNSTRGGINITCSVCDELLIRTSPRVNLELLKLCKEGAPLSERVEYLTQELVEG